MKILFKRIAELAFVGLAFGASMSAHAVDAVGPYYAMPAWDQKLPAATRFVVLTNWSNEAVLDRETGLVWEKSPGSGSSGSWLQMTVHCLKSNKGGRMGWRLPTFPELASLIDSTQPNPYLPVGHPFTVQSLTYWTANSAFEQNAPTVALVVDFSNGINFLDARSKSVGNYPAWCVRGGAAGNMVQ